MRGVGGVNKSRVVNIKRSLNIIGCILVVGVIFGLGFVTAFFTFRPTFVTADFGELVLQELRDAQSAGNNVLNCRSMVGGNGQLKIGKTAGWWESIVPTVKDKAVEPLTANETTVYVFVHGYNPNLDGAIHYGNSLCREIRAVPAQRITGDAPKSVFYTFCWRGDFGPERF